MTSYKFTFDTSFSRETARGGEIDFDVEVEYSVSAFIPATHMQPAEGGEVEILSVRNGFCGGLIDLTDDEEGLIYDEACDRADADIADYLAELAEYRADMIRDARA